MVAEIRRRAPQSHSGVGGAVRASAAPRTAASVRRCCTQICYLALFRAYFARVKVPLIHASIFYCHMPCRTWSWAQKRIHSSCDLFPIIFVETEYKLEPALAAAQRLVGQSTDVLCSRGRVEILVLDRVYV